jgi:hypothetical protein
MGEFCSKACDGKKHATALFGRRYVDVFNHAVAIMVPFA